MDMEQMVEAVKAHALEHYNDGGWDVIVECFTDEEIAAHIDEQNSEADSAEAAIKTFAWLVDVWDERQKDAVISAGEELGSRRS